MREGREYKIGRREEREYKIGKERRERIQDWEGDKEDNTRLGRREGGEKKIGKWGGGNKLLCKMLASYNKYFISILVFYCILFGKHEYIIQFCFLL